MVIKRINPDDSIDRSVMIKEIARCQYLMRLLVCCLLYVLFLIAAGVMKLT